MQEREGDELGVWSEFGSAAGMAAYRAAGSREGVAEVHTGLGDRPDLDGLPPVHTGLGDAPSPDDAPSVGGGLGAEVARLAGALPESALPESALPESALPESALPEPVRPAPEGYRNRVDADGDGTLDKATYRGRADGGADILVDLNRDGRADFVGHDVDLDNRVDFADYDKDRDGVFEKRMYDDDGDGFLDRATWLHT